MRRRDQLPAQKTVVWALILALFQTAVIPPRAAVAGAVSPKARPEIQVYRELEARFNSAPKGEPRPDPALMKALVQAAMSADPERLKQESERDSG